MTKRFYIAAAILVCTLIGIYIWAAKPFSNDGYYRLTQSPDTYLRVQGSSESLTAIPPDQPTVSRSTPTADPTCFIYSGPELDLLYGVREYRNGSLYLKPSTQPFAVKVWSPMTLFSLYLRAR